jgi:hypothetical protein
VSENPISGPHDDNAAVPPAARGVGEAVISLFRYFVWSEEMNRQYVASIRNSPLGAMRLNGWTQEDALQKMEASAELRAWTTGIVFLEPYATYSYGSLYVVIEAWTTEIKPALSDPEIDGLLTSPHANTLKRYRNAAFHYQPKFAHEKFTDFLYDLEADEWARAVRAAFKHWFLSKGFIFP